MNKFERLLRFLFPHIELRERLDSMARWSAEISMRHEALEEKQKHIDKLLKGSLENLAMISRDLSVLRTQRELGIAPKRRPRRRH